MVSFQDKTVVSQQQQVISLACLAETRFFPFPANSHLSLPNWILSQRSKQINTLQFTINKITKNVDHEVGVVERASIKTTTNTVLGNVSVMLLYIGLY